MKRINHRGTETQSHILLCAFVSLWLIPIYGNESQVLVEW